MEIAQDGSSTVQKCQVLKDMDKPDGDACRLDGTLKDASEMEWPHSLSDQNQNRLKRTISRSDGSDFDGTALPRVKVRPYNRPVTATSSLHSRSVLSRVNKQKGSANLERQQLLSKSKLVD